MVEKHGLGSQAQFLLPHVITKGYLVKTLGVHLDAGHVVLLLHLCPVTVRVWKKYITLLGYTPVFIKLYF